MRRSLSSMALVVALSAVAAGPARADAPGPRLRWSVGAAMGFVHPVGAVVPHPDDSESDVFSAGFGIDLRGGVQLTEWLAFDVNGTAETVILAGDARIGALFEVAPAQPFAVALGGGVGALYVLNFFFENPSADYAVGFLRAEGRIPMDTYDEAARVITVGAEGQLGSTFGGDPVPGTLVVGGRAIVGLLWR